MRWSSGWFLVAHASGGGLHAHSAPRSAVGAVGGD